MHTIQLPLMTTPHDEAVLHARFGYIAVIHNQMVKRCKKALDLLRRDPGYQAIMAGYQDAKKAAESGDEDAVRTFEDAQARLFDLREKYNLTQAFLYKFVAVIQGRQYRKHISSQQAQKEAERVWQGVEDVLFGSGKNLHFKKWGDFSTICGKSPTNGIKYFDEQHQDYLGPKEKAKYTHTQKGPDRWNGMICWSGLEIRCRVNWDDKYVRKSIGRNKVSYCEIKRLLFNSGWRYYVVLYLSGDAPRKFKMGKGTAGVDPGVSTEAVDTGEEVFIQELAPMAAEYNSAICQLQVSIDREKRIANPGNYNADGTVKPGRRIWKKSGNQVRKERRMRVLYRKKSAYTNCTHRALANRILTSAKETITEDMDFSALAKRAKNTARSEKTSIVTARDGTKKVVYKFKRKKRFGKSINDRSPGLFLRILEQKYRQYGGIFRRVNTKEFRASQYDHTDGTYTKVPLSQRTKTVGGEQVLRDPYSAFLLRHSQKNGLRPRRKACAEDFEAFLEHQAEFMIDAQMTDAGRPACFGF